MTGGGGVVRCTPDRPLLATSLSLFGAIHTIARPYNLLVFLHFWDILPFVRLLEHREVTVVVCTARKTMILMYMIASSLREQAGPFHTQRVVF